MAGAGDGSGGGLLPEEKLHGTELESAELEGAQKRSGTAGAGAQVE